MNNNSINTFSNEAFIGLFCQAASVGNHIAHCLVFSDIIADAATLTRLANVDVSGQGLRRSSDGRGYAGLGSAYMSRHDNEVDAII